MSRHFDFLDTLAKATLEGSQGTKKLTMGVAELRAALNAVTILIGSAPVGPTTIARLQEYAGKPIVGLQIVAPASIKNRMRIFFRKRCARKFDES